MKKEKLSPFRAGKQAYWCGAICTIDHYIKHLEADKPIVGGSWNPNEYVRKDLFNDFIERMKQEYPEGLDPHDKEHILWCSEGETFENPQWQEHAVDIEAVLNNWIEDFVGPQVDGFWDKCPMFGPIGSKEKYIAVHYYKNGAILIKGHKDHHDEISMRWVMFFPESVWNAMGISCSDSSDYCDDETCEVNEPVGTASIFHYTYTRAEGLYDDIYNMSLEYIRRENAMGNIDFTDDILHEYVTSLYRGPYKDFEDLFVKQLIDYYVDMPYGIKVRLQEYIKHNENPLCPKEAIGTALVQAFMTFDKEHYKFSTDDDSMTTESAPLIREYKTFWTKGHPTDNTIREALNIVKGQQFVIELHWFVQYSGNYEVCISSDDTLESVKERLPKIYPV